MFAHFTLALLIAAASLIDLVLSISIKKIDNTQNSYLEKKITMIQECS